MADDAVRQHGAGEPDQLERLWTPYRMAYIRGDERPVGHRGGGVPVLPDPAARRRRGPGRPPRRAGVRRAQPLSRTPPGHLMVCPYRHIPDYTDTTDEEVAEIGALTKQAMTVLRSVSRRRGLQPRHEPGRGPAARGSAPTCTSTSCRAGWATPNFMPIIGRTKTLPQLLADTRELLADAWA